MSKKLVCVILFLIVLFILLNIGLTQSNNRSEKAITIIISPVMLSIINSIPEAPNEEFYSETILVKVTEKTKEKVEKQIKNLEKEIIMLSKLLYREARANKIPIEEKAAVVWCVLNRVDSGRYSDSIQKVIQQRNQFAWIPNSPIWDNLYNISKDVVIRWLLEKEGYAEVGRVLPVDYLFFAGKKGRNHFRKEYNDDTYWGWTLPNPYERLNLN